MKNAYNRSTIIRPMLRALVLLTLFIGPFAGFAVASANDSGRDMSGAGFVLYMAMMRG